MHLRPSSLKISNRYKNTAFSFRILLVELLSLCNVSALYCGQEETSQIRILLSARTSGMGQYRWHGDGIALNFDTGHKLYLRCNCLVQVCSAPLNSFCSHKRSELNWSLHALLRSLGKWRHKFHGVSMSAPEPLSVLSSRLSARNRQRFADSLFHCPATAYDPF